MQFSLQTESLFNQFSKDLFSPNFELLFHCKPLKSSCLLADVLSTVYPRLTHPIKLVFMGDHGPTYIGSKQQCKGNYNSQLTTFEFLGLMTTFQKNEENEIIRSQIECAFLSIRSQNWPLALSSRISFSFSLIYNYTYFH